MFREYLSAIGLEHIAPVADESLLNTIVDDVFGQIRDDFSEEDVRDLYVYDVPRLSPDGSCSILEEKNDIPYNLAITLGLAFDIPALTNHPNTLRLWRLHRIVEQTYALTHVDWLGIYRKTQTGEGETVLVKESYLGVFSRPEFPLTEEFAQHSNNSTVGLTGKAVIIQDVSGHTGPYYNCDTKVDSEFCVPIISPNDAIIGIIDVESFRTNHFSDDVALQIAKVAMDLGRRGLGIHQ
jgi:L-methionine (R)-S-oxide reductase